MFCFFNRGDIRTISDFLDIGKSELNESFDDLVRTNLITELSDKSRSDDRRDLLVVFNRLNDLIDFALIHDCTVRTGYHAHPASDTFIAYDDRTFLIVFGKSVDTASGIAWTFVFGNRVVRTDIVAFTAQDAFLLVDKRVTVLHAGSSDRTHRNTGMRQTTVASIGDEIALLFTRFTCVGNDR